MKQFKTLLLREFWEHSILWKLPLVLFVVVVLANILLSNIFQFTQYAPDNSHSGILKGAFGSINWLIFIAFSCLALFYLLDCLFSERKDRSILFWRSLPVSDTQSVLSKLAFATIILPLIIWLTMITAHLTTILVQGMVGTDHADTFMGVINLGSYWLNLLQLVFMTMLWSLPLMCWVLFCSSWAKKTPLLFAAAIPVLISLFDGVLGLDLGLAGHMMDRLPIGFGKSDTGIGELFSLSGGQSSSLTTFLSQPAVWTGLIISALFTAAAIWIRRWRDDA